MKFTANEKKLLSAFASPFLKDTMERLDTLFYAAWSDDTKIVIRRLIDKLKDHYDDNSYAVWYLSYQFEREYRPLSK